MRARRSGTLLAIALPFPDAHGRISSQLEGVAANRAFEAIEDGIGKSAGFKRRANGDLFRSASIRCYDWGKYTPIDLAGGDLQRIHQVSVRAEAMGVQRPAFFARH